MLCGNRRQWPWSSTNTVDVSKCLCRHCGVFTHLVEKWSSFSSRSCTEEAPETLLTADPLSPQGGAQTNSRPWSRHKKETEQFQLVWWGHKRRKKRNKRNVKQKVKRKTGEEEEETPENTRWLDQIRVRWRQMVDCGDYWIDYWLTIVILDHDELRLFHVPCSISNCTAVGFCLNLF